MPTSPPTEPLGAWVLAGGLSSRFGSDKALFLVGHETLLSRTARVCREAGLAATVVARAERPGGLPTLVEPDGSRHPLHGVATALAAAAALHQTHALFVPCDLPGIEVANLRILLDAHARGHATVHADSVRLFSILPVSAAPLAAQLAAQGGSVRELLEALRSTPVDVGRLENLNRPG